jgi:hypothetical protein
MPSLAPTELLETTGHTFQCSHGSWLPAGFSCTLLPKMRRWHPTIVCVNTNLITGFPIALLSMAMMVSFDRYSLPA